MRTFFLLILFFYFSLCIAQNKMPEVVTAEKNFAAYSVQHGTKAAFLQFADSTGLLFEGANDVRAIETWSKREARPGVLNWHPVYAFTAASGDMGFTSGPWTFQPRTVNDSIVARGQYNTVWHKTIQGEWKFLLDMGLSNTPPFDSTSFSFSSKKLAFVPGTIEDLLAAEQQFMEQTIPGATRAKAYLEALSANPFLLNRNGRLPATRSQAVEEMLNAVPGATSYRIKGSGISRSGDLGYVYGTAEVAGKTDSYLRIWRREGKQWKLALEVLAH